jgi:hypothetical protein
MEENITYVNAGQRDMLIITITGRGNISLPYSVQTCSGVHPASYSMGTYRGPFPRAGKEQGREAKSSPPSSAEVMDAIPLSCVNGIVLN